MVYSDESYNLRIELNTKGCELSAREIEQMEEDLHTLRALVESFPVSNLYITVVHHARSGDYHIKTSLALCGKTLFTGDRDVLVHAAYERCIRKLVKKVSSYKQQMQGDFEQAKQVGGTHSTLNPTQSIDVEQLEQAVARDDYAAFRRVMDPYEEGLSSRIGRWISRYPEIETQLGETIKIADIVEDVFLTAFENYAVRPGEILPGDWLEGFIDPSVQAFIQSPDEEFARISFARAVSER